MPPCFGSAACAAPEVANQEIASHEIASAQIAGKANITAANLRTLRMLFSLLFGLVAVDWSGPIGGDHSHRGRAEQPAKPLAALAIWMKYGHHDCGKTRRATPTMSRTVAGEAVFAAHRRSVQQDEWLRIGSVIVFVIFDDSFRAAPI